MTSTLSFIGCGHLGKTLGRLWAATGVFVIQDILTRSAASAASAARYIGAGNPVLDQADLKAADIYLIATTDDGIVPACEALAQTGLLHAGSVVFHCSGALPASILSPAKQRGAAIASVHPIRSFASPDEAAEHFSGTWCGVEGDEAALAVLESAFAAIGARSVRIDPAQKTLYHAAAVFASNYTTALLGIAQDAYSAAGISPATSLQLMEPLVRACVDNVFRLGPAQALSGPAARGDMATVEKQLAAVSAWRPEYGEIYRQLAAAAVALAAKRRTNH